MPFSARRAGREEGKVTCCSRLAALSGIFFCGGRRWAVRASFRAEAYVFGLTVVYGGYDDEIGGSNESCFRGLVWEGEEDEVLVGSWGAEVSSWYGAQGDAFLLLRRFDDKDAFPKG